MAYEPKGIRFFDIISGREMLLVGEGETFAGWICYRHPDGQWVSLRKATDEDRAKLQVCDHGKLAGECPNEKCAHFYGAPLM